MKTVLITGATGFLGYNLTLELLKSNSFNLIAIGGRPEDKAHFLPDHPRLKVYHLDSLFSLDFKGLNTIVNCAFARSNDSRLLSESLDFTEKLIHWTEKTGIESIINISSQGVYKRLKPGELSTENSPIEPIDLYSMAKYASEKMYNISSIPSVTNVRLASIYMPQRFLSFFVQKAKIGESFTVTAPYQYASLIDVKDAASGLSAIVSLQPEQRANTYNLGTGKQHSLLEYASSVKEIGHELGYNVRFTVSENSTSVCAGMDCKKIMVDTGWRPTIFKDKMIRNIFSESQINEQL